MAEITKKIVERARWTREHNATARYVYAQRVQIERLDDAGRLKEREARLYRAALLDGAAFPRLVERNGKPLTPRELQEEQRREKKFRRELVDRSSQKGKLDDDPPDLDEEFVNRFSAQVLGREQVNGRWAYVLHFEPKRKDLPARRRLEHILNLLTGRIWVDEQDFEIAKIEAHLTEPVRLGWGLIGLVRNLDFVGTQARLDDVTWLPSRLDAYFKGRLLFTSLHQRRAMVWEDFRKVAPPPNAPTSPILDHTKP